MKSVYVLLLLCLVCVCAVSGDNSGKVLFEYYWTDGEPVLGSLRNAASYPDWPNAVEWRPSLEGKTNWREAYGTCVRGYIHPPADGEYTFWIASDDQSELWLYAFTNPDGDTRSPIAWVNGWTPARDFDNTGGGLGGPEQQSAPIYLEAGAKYYFRVIHVEGVVGDNLAVAWQGPGIPERQIIDGRYLSTISGLKGEYFPNPALEGSPSRVRVDSTVNFDWGDGEIFPEHVDSCSVRWTGELEIPSTGSYTFYVTGDDGARLWLDGQLLINAWWEQGETEHASGPVALSSGQRCRIRLEWFEAAQSASCQLMWSGPSLDKQVISSDCLSPVAVSADMVGWWTCDEGVGGMVYDSSGNGHHGILKGNVTWTRGQVGKALAFGGNLGDYVDLGHWDPSEGTGQLTLSHWLYWSGQGGQWQGTVSKRDTWSPDEMMWQLELTTNSTPPGYINFNRDGDYPLQGFSLPTQKWVHVAVTFDGTRSTLYQNGEVVGTSLFSFGSDTASALTLGACEANGSNPWKGYIDDVRLYNRALTQEEISEIIASSTFRYRTADLTRDHRVNLADFAILAGKWLMPANTVPDDMVLIPGGTFQMGDGLNEGWSNERPVHMVTLSLFYISRHEIINAQYCEFLNAVYPSEVKVVNGIVYACSDSANSYPFCETSSSSTTSQIAFSNDTFSIQTKGSKSMLDNPVVEVSWYGAVAYCNWRSHQEGRLPCYNMSAWTCAPSKSGYRLPTEAQWEYAARGGLAAKRFPWGDTITHSQANYDSLGEYYDISATRGLHPTWNDGFQPCTSFVGFFAPNGYGLYDMAGNVAEWCNDWYGSYSPSAQSDPIGPSSGNTRVLRGGSWKDYAKYCRVSNRLQATPLNRYMRTGFRVVLSE